MLEILRDGEKPVAELVSSFRLSRVSISQHLRILRTSGAVTQRRSGRNRVYQINAARLREIHQWVSQFERLWTRSRSAP